MMGTETTPDDFTMASAKQKLLNAWDALNDAMIGHAANHPKGGSSSCPVCGGLRECTPDHYQVKDNLGNTVDCPLKIALRALVGIFPAYEDRTAWIATNTISIQHVEFLDKL